jgi:hypothetical protein
MGGYRSFLLGPNIEPEQLARSVSLITKCHTTPRSEWNVFLILSLSRLIRLHGSSLFSFDRTIIIHHHHIIITRLLRLIASFKGDPTASRARHSCAALLYIIE